MTDIDIDAIARLMRRAAQQEIMPRFRQLEAGQVREKTSPIDLVTDADEEAEKVIAAGIAELLPEALFIGEESVAADPGIMEGRNEAPLVVYADPVDGTFSFAAGLPLFGTMIAVVRNGETVAGIIYDPIGDDWVLAEKGGGAFLRRTDGSEGRIRAAGPVPVEDMTGFASPSFLPFAERTRVMGNLAKVRFAAGLRCAAHEYRTLCSGHVHFAMFQKLMPWDHLPGALIAGEAGAHVARFDGGPYRPEHLDGGLLIAPDRESWQALRDNVFTV